MIAALIGWSANNLILILIGAALATGAGIYALLHVPLDAIPDLPLNRSGLCCEAIIGVERVGFRFPPTL